MGRHSVGRAAGAAAALALCAALTPVWAPPAAAAQEPIRESASEPVLLIMDASGSMRADDGTGRPKIEAAKAALRRVVAGLPDEAQVGLRVYGHRVPNTDKAAGCQDTELVVPVAPLDRVALTRAVDGFAATGYTPLGLSLQAAGDDLPADRPGTVVLVSDGIDTCAPPDPCAVVGELVARRVNVQVETIGFQVDAQARAQLQCIADTGGGTYRDASDTEQLVEALESIQVEGDPVSGTPTAEGAPVIGGGQYRDTITLGAQDWYAVELAEGQSVRAAAVVAQDDERRASPTAVFSASVRRGDVLGDLDCDREEVSGIGPEPRAVAVESPTIAPDEGPCAEPGPTYLVLELAQDEGEGQLAAEDDPLEEVELDTQLTVEVVGEAVEPVAAVASPSPAPVALEDPGSVTGPPAVSTGWRVLAGLAFALLGYLAGAVAARRTGP